MYVVYYFSRDIIEKDAKKNVSDMLYTTTLNIDQTLDEVESTVKNMGWLVTEHLNDTAYMYHMLVEVVKINEEIVGSAIAFRPDFYPDKYYFSPYAYDTEDNITKTKQLGNDHYNYFEMEWYNIPSKTKQPQWSSPYYDEGGGEEMMTTFSYPILDTNNEVIAIITADISLEWLTSRICNLYPYTNSHTILVGRNGQYLSGNQPELSFEEDILESAYAQKNPDFKDLIKTMLDGESGTMSMDDDKRYSFAVYGPLSNGWSTAIISPYEDVFSHLKLMRLILIVVSIAGIWLLFFFCLKVINKITHPITEFSVAAMNMAKGNFQAKLPKIKTKDEIHQLYTSFDYLQKSINQYIQELKTTTAANERFESELNVARKIQLSMVPTNFIDNERVSIHALMRPAKAVGGDFYDFVTKDDEIFFAIGDVSGKGVPAALVMAITRNSFRLLGSLGLPIDKMIEKINDTQSMGNDNGMFVTLFAGKINLKTGEMTYCNAGHNPMVICNADGHAEYLHANPHIAVGVFEGFTFQLERIQLEKGSRIILYTDGITEAENAEQQQFGTQRLLEFASSIPADKSSEAVTDDLIKEVEYFVQGAEQNDDITILTISLK
jgi:sigma-B regulation protein RsbU (phosphoserine phosphatase)